MPKGALEDWFYIGGFIGCAIFQAVTGHTVAALWTAMPGVFWLGVVLGKKV